MSVSITCDWCGELIEGEPHGPGWTRGEAHLEAMGMYDDRGVIHEQIGHFHAGSEFDDDSCLLRALWALAEHHGVRIVTRRDRLNQKVHESRERRDAWFKMPWDVRERLLLEALGDKRLTVREIEQGMKALPEFGGEIYTNDVRALAERMISSGRLDRVNDPFRNKPRWRYFLLTPSLDGPIADLERAYHDDGEAVA
jgi:hypothetical protein